MNPQPATTSAEPRADRSRLGDILVDYGILTPDGVRAALARQQATGARFGEAVVALGLAKTNDLLWALSEQFGVRSTVLGAAMVDRAALALLGEDRVRRWFILPVAMDEESITLATDDPLNAAGLEEAARAAGRAPRMLLTSTAALREAMAEVLGDVPTPQPAAQARAEQEAGRAVWLGDFSPEAARTRLTPGAAFVIHGPSPAANARVALDLFAGEDLAGRRALWLAAAGGEDALRAGFVRASAEEARRASGTETDFAYADGAEDGARLPLLADLACEGAAAIAGLAVADPDLAARFVSLRAPALFERATAVALAAPLGDAAGTIAVVAGAGFGEARRMRKVLLAWARRVAGKTAVLRDPALRRLLDAAPWRP